MQSFEQAFATLNPEQKSAVTYGSGPLLVVAGAGSGKTRVATIRVAYLIKEGVHPQSIVGVTFTNKAAKEMRERVHSLVGSKVSVSTFHSLGATILRECIHHLGYPNSFAIYDEEESSKILKDCLKELNIVYQDSLFSSLRKGISSAKNNPSATMDAALSSLYEMYQKRLKAAGAVDFDDLIYLPIKIFREKPETLEMYHKRWQHLLVDEYQDTNDTQHLFAQALVGKTQNIFAVGDPDQSIYSWRGAKIDNILSFKDHFPGAHVIRLEQNYRSTNTILEASNGVIAHNQSRYEKNLWSQRGRGDAIIKHTAKSERQEAEYVLKNVQKLIQEGFSHSQIAILYRTNAQSRSFEDHFLSTRTPYRIWGGLPFYSRKEIKDVLSFLRLASLPQDVAAFERSIKAFGQGIGEVTVQKLRALSLATGRPIFTAVQEELSSSSFPLTKRHKEALSHFCNIISNLQKNLQEGSAFELISSAMNETGYMKSLEQDAETFSDRKENLEQLLGRAQEWDDAHENTPPYIFFEELVLEGAQVDNDDSRNKVTLATIHHAKGLEFSVVFLVGLEEDLLPHINAKKSESTAELEEERRLFYVGMTRAKDHLFLTASQTRFLFGALRSMRPSRFWKELPSELIKDTSPRSSDSYYHKVGGRDHFSRQWRKDSRDDADIDDFQDYQQVQREKKCLVPSLPPNLTVEPCEDTTAKQEKPPKTEKYAPGQIVLHPQFGIGRIEKIVTTSMGEAYEVLFSNDQTRKKILAALSPLKAVGKPPERLEDSPKITLAVPEGKIVSI